MVRDWWGLGFSNTSLEDLKGYLLEMRGLGVLVRNEATGLFRLRSPNLVRLMGTDDDIANRLLELESKEPRTKPSSDDHHASLANTAQIYSPLTYAQESRLVREKSGIGIIFASEATGYDNLPKALERFIPVDLPDELGKCTEIPYSITQPVDLRNWLRSYVEQHNSYERLTVYVRPISLSSDELANLVDEAIQFCSGQRSQKRWLRVYFVFRPSDTWIWLNLPLPRREDLENRVDAYEFAECWNINGISYRLDRHDKLATDEICQQVEKVTAGWPNLIDELFRRGKHYDLRPDINKLATELGSSSSELSQRFRKSLGIGINPVIEQMVQVLTKLQTVEEELFTPSFIKLEYPDSSINQTDCTNGLEFLRRMSVIKKLDGKVILNQAVMQVFSEND